MNIKDNIENHHPADIGLIFNFQYWLKYVNSGINSMSCTLGSITSPFVDEELLKFINAENGETELYLSIYADKISHLMQNFNYKDDDEIDEKNDSFLISLSAEGFYLENDNLKNVKENIINYWFDNKEEYFKAFAFLAQLNYTINKDDVDGDNLINTINSN